MYSVTKIKTFTGMEGPGYNATLLRDGKIVALVIDDASGGPVRYEWGDDHQPRVKAPFRNYDDTIGNMNMSPEEAKWNQHVIEQPKYKYNGKMCTMTPDVYLETLITMAKVQDRVKRMLVKGDKILMVDDGNLATVKIRAGDSVMDATPRIQARYPKAQILNGMPLDKALAIAVPFLMPKD